MKESDIQFSICEYLALRKVFFWRQNTVPVFHKGEYRRMPAFSRNGVPDIIVVKDGQFIGLEVKTPKGRQSDVQKEFENELVAAGGVYNIVTSIEDVQALGL